MVSNNNNVNQRQQEAHALESFYKVVRKRLETSQALKNLANQSDSGADSLDYASERKVLMQVNSLGLREGIAAGFITFITLRFAPHLIVRYMSKGSSSASPFSSTAAAAVAPLPFRVIRFGLDVTVSLVIAASTSLYFTDLDKAFKAVSEIPLVEGKSIVAHEFCTVVQQESTRYPPEFWESVQSAPLRSIQDFCTNCQKRQTQEALLRQQLQLSPTDPVKIPSPGVVTDVLDDDGFMEPNIFADNNNQETMFSTTEFQDTTWTDSMTTDQEQGNNDKSGW